VRNYGDTCPIAARATAAGPGALALIRTCGENSLTLLARVFSRTKALLDAPGSTVIHGWITASGGRAPADEVLVSVYRSPKSYTGEDGADISCHGGEAAVRAVLESLRTAGFADALPGEFTFRAFMNGKLDLTRCESVMEVVSARTGAAAERALRRLSGALERELGEIKAELVEALAAAEIVLDYPEDEIDGALPSWRETAAGARARLAALAAAYGRERLYREGALAVIAGRPNAGKSSLFNALLGEDRSIVTEIPGTTRDWIEAPFSLEGIPVRLADTAGLREAADDPVEAFGIKAGRELLNNADIIIYVIDGTAGFSPEDKIFIELLREKNIVRVWNKADLVPCKDAACVSVSAKTGEGVERLCSLAAAALMEQSGTGADGPLSAGLGTARQKDLVDRAAASLEEACALADSAAELAAPLLRDAINAIGEITGEISTADILETMFSRFCVGK
jgi:tRNA modification GTPase